MKHLKGIDSMNINEANTIEDLSSGYVKGFEVKINKALTNMKKALDKKDFETANAEFKAAMAEMTYLKKWFQIK